MLVGYFDESGSNDADYFAMAGFLAPVEKWRKFEREWKKALLEYRVPYVHMKEYAHSRGPFSGWDKPTRDAFMKKLIWVITSHAVASVAVALSPSDYYSVFPRNKRSSPYFLCFQSWLAAVLIYCSQHGVSDNISIVFDSSNQSKLNLAGYFRAFQNCRDIPNREQLVSLSVADDKVIMPLQAADLLAYEILKHARGYRRKSLRVLSRDSYGAYWVWTRKMLEQQKADRLLTKTEG